MPRRAVAHLATRVGAVAGALVLVVVAVVGLASPAVGHPLGAGPPPTAELTADGNEVRVAWTAQDDDLADLLEHLELVPEGTSEMYRWWAVGDPLTDDEREAASAAPELEAYVADRVAVTQDGTACPGEVAVADDVVNDGLEVRFACPDPVDRVEVEIALLHDVDPDYRTVAFVGEAGTGEFAAFTVTSPVHTMRVGDDADDGVSGDAFGALSAWLGLSDAAQARAEALADADATVPALALAVVVAFAVGAGHGLGPGHAKAATAAYVTGGRGRSRDAFLVGALVALAHTGTVIAIGAALALLPVDPASSQAFAPGLTAAAGLLIVSVGVVMLRRHRRGEGHGHDHEPAVGHGQGPGVGHGQGPGVGHGQGPGVGHGHEHGHEAGRDHGAAAGGLTDDAGEAAHGGGRAGPRRSELAIIGLAGGLLPSPTALVLLVATWVAGRVEIGLLLVAAFGLGLAATVAAVALLALHGRDVLVRQGETRVWARRVAAAIPFAGALVVTASGTVLAGLGVLGLL